MTIDAETLASATAWLDAYGEKRVLPSFVQRVEYPDDGPTVTSWECGVYHGSTLAEVIVETARSLGWTPPVAAPVDAGSRAARIEAAAVRLRDASSRWLDGPADIDGDAPLRDAMDAFDRAYALPAAPVEPSGRASERERALVREGIVDGYIQGDPNRADGPEVDAERRENLRGMTPDAECDAIIAAVDRTHPPAADGLDWMRSAMEQAWGVGMGDARAESAGRPIRQMREVHADLDAILARAAVMVECRSGYPACEECRVQMPGETR